MKFQTNNSLYKLMNLIIYLFLLYLFIDLLMKSGILDEQIDKLSELSNLFTIKIETILTVISVVFTFIATLIEYGFSLFLITLFFDKNKRNFGDILLSKNITLSFSILLCYLFNPSDIKFAYFSVLIVLLIGITNYARFKNLRLTVVFSVPFLFNAIMSIINSF
ncbi:membrane protein [Streptococcus pneumoniae]|nr:membrane protein [Streptococcus pneumoniae]VIV04549.1 membrane protein [Streptococcus pneumoniae]VIV06140.1 membrane protein [Streptococcus pneumoniae]VIV60688.1 membrane protein [Streptococcus pneumoniae]VIV81917.1 membrane protein [Streptococcus pneumoniae]